jgi:pimeloyl-ACP methyl ester carboxylesterase
MSVRALAATVLAVVMTVAVLGSAAVTRTVHYAAEPACTSPPATSPVYAGGKQRVARTARGPIAYYSFGGGSPVLLVTGFRSTLSEWNATFLAALAQHHTVVVFDNRGVGRSIPDATRFTVGDMARDTAALIDALKLRRPTVVGWSMGGSVVQQLAIDDPAAISRMVLMGALAPGAPGVPIPPAVLAKLSGAPGVTFDDIMAVLFPAASVAEAERCFQQEMYRPGDYRPSAIPSAVTAGQSALLAVWAGDDAAAALLPKVRIATLILSGTEDDIVSVRNAHALRRLLPRSRLLEVDDAGHAMMYQYPVALARAIGAFAGR